MPLHLFVLLFATQSSMLSHVEGTTSAGIAEPLPVAEAFTFGDEDGTEVSDFARVDTMVRPYYSFI